MGKLTWKLKSVHKNIFLFNCFNETNFCDTRAKVAQMHPWCGHADQHNCVHDADTQTSTIVFMMRTHEPAQLSSWCAHATLLCPWCWHPDQHNCIHDADTQPSAIVSMMLTREPAQLRSWCEHADHHKCVHDADAWTSTNADMRWCLL